MRGKNLRHFMFLTLYLLFSQFLVPAGAEQDAGGIVSTLRGNPKLVGSDEILADFAKGAPETAVIVRVRPSEEAKALENRSRSSSRVPPEFAKAGAAPYYNLRDRNIKSQLRSTVATTVGRALGRLEPQGVTVKREFSYLFGFAANVTPAALARIAAMPEVISVEKNHILQAQLAQGIPLINATAARYSYTGSGLSIAICDTGIDSSHPALGGGGFPNAKVIGGYDIGDKDADPRPDPLYGNSHGTSCAGIAAGNTGTFADYIGGVAPDAKLYALKISTGTSGNSTLDAMMAAWEWAITHQDNDPANPIMIISMSFSVPYPSDSICDSSLPAMTAAAANAVAAGITIFVSSGNQGYCAAVAPPACISYVNSVGAVFDADFGIGGWCIDANSCAPKTASSCPTGWTGYQVTAADKVTIYSNSASFLTLFAPSHNAYVPDIVGQGGSSTGDYDPTFGGTSAACPYAAGAAAVLQHAAKVKTGSYLTPAEVRAYLVDNGDNVTDTKVAITKPRINLGRAVDALVAEPDFAMAVSPVSVAVTPGTTGNTSVTTTVSGGFNSAVALTVTGLPTGVTALLNPASIPAPGSGSSSLTLSVPPAAPSGSYTVTVTGSGDGVTRTATFTLVIPGGPVSTLFSNGFEEMSGWFAQGSVTWDITSQGEHPVASPHGGVRMAAFRSYDAFDGQSLLYRGSGLEIPSSASTATLSFWMYHDTDYVAEDSIQVQVSTDGATWSNVGAPIVRYDGTNRWAEVAVDLNSYKGAANLRLGFLGTSYYGSDIYLDDITVVTEGGSSPDFAIAVSPAAGAIPQGGSLETAITTTVSGGFNDSVSLTVTGLPAGATASFTPPAIAAPGAGSSTMTVTTTTSVPVGVYTLTVTGSGGITHSAVFILTVTQPLQITTTTLPSAAVNKAYSAPVAALNGTAPYSWSASGLPSGLSINAGTGVISGTPANVVASTANFATFPVTVTVTDRATGSGSKNLTLRVNQSAPAAPTGLTATAASASRVVLTWSDNANNESVVQIQRATNAAFTVGLTSITLPGTALTTYSDTGVVSGSTYYYRVRAGNYVAWCAFSNTATVTPQATLAISTASLPNGAVNAAYNRPVSATGGTAPYSWSATGLPTGVAISPASGNISGTPANVVPANAGYAVFPVTVTVTDGASATASRNLTLRINQSSPAAPSALVATATDPTRAVLTWNDNANNESVIQIQRARSADFSTGLTSVTLSGATLTTYTDNVVSSGTWYYRVRGGNYVAWSATWSNSATVTLDVTGVAITTTSLANGAVNGAYSRAVAASGGSQPYAWSATGLPGGLSINPATGVVSGTPGNVVPANANFATFPVAVTVTDGASATATASFTLRINQSAPAVPSALTATAASPTRVVLAWNDNANNESVIRVQRSTAADFSTALTSVTLSGTAFTGYTDNGAVSGATYYYRVRSGNYVAWSTTYSNTAIVTTP